MLPNLPTPTDPHPVSRRRVVPVALTLLMIGLLLSYGALAVGTGTVHTLVTDGRPGVIDVRRCDSSGRGASTCFGSFTPDDGGPRNERATTLGDVESGTHGVLIEGRSLGPIAGIPGARDTFYPGDGPGVGSIVWWFVSTFMMALFGLPLTTLAVVALVKTARRPRAA